MVFVILIGASYSGLQYGHATKYNIGNFCRLNEVAMLNLYHQRNMVQEAMSA
jgi:hypothetical protein